VAVGKVGQSSALSLSLCSSNSYSPNSEFPNSDPVSDVPNNLHKNDPGGGAAVTPLNSVPSPCLDVVPCAKLSTKPKTKRQARYRATPPEIETVWNHFKTLRTEAYDSKVLCIKNQHTDPGLGKMIDALGVEMSLKVVEKYIQTDTDFYFREEHSLEILIEDFGKLADRVIIQERLGNTGVDRAKISKTRKLLNGRV
jgi:hypothetical protein